MGRFCVTILQFLLRWAYGLRPHQALSCLGAIIIHLLMPSWLLRPIAAQ